MQAYLSVIVPAVSQILSPTVPGTQEELKKPPLKEGTKGTRASSFPLLTGDS